MPISAAHSPRVTMRRRRSSRRRTAGSWMMRAGTPTTSAPGLGGDRLGGVGPIDALPSLTEAFPFHRKHDIGTVTFSQVGHGGRDHGRPRAGGDLPPGPVQGLATAAGTISGGAPASSNG